MVKLKILAMMCICALCVPSVVYARDTWFADIAVNDPLWYSPGPGQFVNNPLYNNPLRCIGSPDGADEPWSPKHSASVGYVTTLGDRDTTNDLGWIILGFSEPVQDNPKNPYGLDFVVFSNCYFITAIAPEYDPGYRWQEVAFVEISNDLVNWYLIRPNILPSELVGGMDTGASETVLSGYAEYTPSIHLPTSSASYDPFCTVTRTAEELYSVPERPSVPECYNTLRFDYVSGGGDAFDIADAVVESSPGVPTLDTNGNEIPAGLSEFKYVRLTDAVAGDSASGLGEISAEIDAVSAVRPAITIGEAKHIDSGDYALITEAVVTAVFSDKFYIESPDRTAAIRVDYDTSAAVDGKYVEVGDKLTITGHVSISDGHYILPDPMFSCTSLIDMDSQPKPLGMTLKSLESDMAYGMLIRTWGKVTDSDQGYCIISDGAANARVVWTDESYSLPEDYDYVVVSGICDREEGDTLIRVVDPQSDIELYQSQTN
ncbi:hypothetical protein LLG46_00420 [bacterium]|nr:hypothetical protein [bacterium]